MNNLKRYEELIEEFSAKSYMYTGDSIRLDVKEKGAAAIFVMNSPELEKKLNIVQKNELTSILGSAMEEVLKYRETDKSIKTFLGWS